MAVVWLLVCLLQEGGGGNKTMNNAHTNYIQPSVSVHVKKI